MKITFCTIYIYTVFYCNTTYYIFCSLIHKATTITTMKTMPYPAIADQLIALYIEKVVMSNIKTTLIYIITVIQTTSPTAPEDQETL